MSTFPELKGTSKGGKTMLWLVKVEEEGGKGVITVQRGYEGGTVQMDRKIVEVGKNLGKKNETTPFEQAVLEARTLWNKKQREGYEPPSAIGGAGEDITMTSVPATVTADRSTTLTLSAPMPMLANKWSEKAKYIKFPCMVQPKYDGTRTVAICGLPEGEPCLFSRQRKAYPHLEHIQAIVRRLPKGLILDGELFTTKVHFQTIVGLAKKKTLTAEDRSKHDMLELHCYDIIDVKKPFNERIAQLNTLFATHKKIIGSVLQLCPTREVAKAEDLKKIHDEYVSQKFEGLMIRNKAGLYDVGNRSNDLLKMKEFEDDEFEIVDFYEGDGLEKGCIMWRCKTKEGLLFGCRPEGTREEKQELFKNGALYIGKMLTVRYQELTKDRVPRFPVGIRIRDYE
jgi:ATP-dependent DNA ligase